MMSREVVGLHAKEGPFSNSGKWWGGSHMQDLTALEIWEILIV